MARPTSSSVPNSTLKCTSEPPSPHSNSEADHEIVTQDSFLTVAMSGHHYHRIVGAGDQFETATEVCDSRRQEVFRAIERRRDEGWQLHSAVKLTNQKTKLTFRRPLPDRR
jgi:hypothetical protein